MLDNVQSLSATPQDVRDELLFQRLSEIHQALNSLLSYFKDIQEAADDVDAAAKGIAVGEWYLSTGTLVVRKT